MKRFLALLTTLLLVLSLFPVSALAADEPTDTTEPTAAVETATPEPTVEPTDTATPVGETTPEPIVTPEPAATEPLASESPTPEAAFLRLLGCDRLDSDGTGYHKISCEAGEALSIKVETESNAQMSYRWQLLDTASHADDPYVDIDTKDNTTADEQTLEITADEALLGVKDALRCVVSATLGDQTLETVCYFTLESKLPPLDLQAQGEIDIVRNGDHVVVGTFEELQAALAEHDSVIYTDDNFAITENFEVPDGVIFVVTGTTLTIESDVTVTNHGYFGIYGTSGVIDVKGTIQNYNDLGPGNGSTLNIASGGEYIASSDVARVLLSDDGASTNSKVIGIPNSQIEYECNVHSVDDWNAAFTRTTMGYRFYRFTVVEPVTITSDTEILSNMELYVESSLTNGASATMTINGKVEVRGGSLINQGEIINNGNLMGNGVFINHGTISGSGDIGVYTPVTSEAQLRDVIEQGATFAQVKGSFSLSENLTIPSGTHISIYHATLTVPHGIMLENNGTISSDEAGAQLIVEGTLKNAGPIICWDGGEITFQSGGTYAELGDDAHLEINDNGATSHSVINGVDNATIFYSCNIRTAEDLAAALERSSAGYTQNYIVFQNEYTFATNTEIPAYCGLWSDYDLTVAEDVTLTNYGALRTTENAIFTNHGKIVNEGSINIDGQFVNDGELTGNGDFNITQNVSTEAELRAALEAGKSSINLNNNITLTKDLVIPSDANIGLNSAIIEIANGVTVTNNAWINLNAAGFLIHAGGSFISNNGVSLDGGSSFAVESGGIYNDGTAGNLYLHAQSGSSISGVDPSEIMICFDVRSEADIHEALTNSGLGYRGIEIHQQADITLTDSLTLSQESQLYLEGEHGCLLRVPSGKTLTNNGYINVGGQSTLQIDSGAKLANYGTLTVNGNYVNEGETIGDGEFIYGELCVYSWDELKAAVERGTTKIYIDADITMEESLTLQAGTTWGLDDYDVATLTVPSGITLTVDGELYVSAGAVDILSGATLENHGWINLHGGNFITRAGSTFIDDADVDLVGSAKGIFEGTYTPGPDHWFAYTDTDGGATFTGIDKKDVFYWADVNSMDDINALTPKVLDGYRYFSLYLQSDLTLPANYEVPERVYLGVMEGNTLTIAAGNTATIYGKININSGATLEIQTGANLVIVNEGVLHIDGTLIGDGTITGNFEYSAKIASDSDLRIALAAGATRFDVIGDFTLESDFTLPEGTFMTIEGVTMTVPNGITMTNRGQLDIHGGTLMVQSGATLDIRGGIWIYELTADGLLSVASGATYIRADGAWLAFLYGEGVVNGVANDQVGIAVHVDSEAKLKTALLMNLSSYSDATVYVVKPITLSANLKVPAGIELEIALFDEYAGSNGLTIPVGVTLTNAGIVRIQENNTLVVKGTLANVGDGSFEILGSLVNTGSITYSDNATVQRFVRSEDELIAAVEQNTRTITYIGDITLTKDLVVPDSVILDAGGGANLTVGDGVTLTLGATKVWLCRGSLRIADGGTLIAKNHARISIWDSGALIIDGTLTMEGDASKIIYRANGAAQMQNLPDAAVSHVYAYIYAYNQAELIEGLNYFKDSPYPINEVYPIVSMTMSEDITIPNGADLILNDGAVLTVPTGRTLTIAEGGYIRVEQTGGLIVQGTLENSGEMELASNKVTITGSLIDHTGETTYTLRAETLAQLKTLLTSTQRPLTIYCAGFAINTNLTIPSGITVTFEHETSASIEKGITVTVAGSLGTFGNFLNSGTIVNNGKLTVEWEGVFTNAGTLTNNSTAKVFGKFINNATVTAAADQKVRFYDGAVRGGTNAGGSWYVTEGVPVSALAITGPDTIGIGESLAKTYSAAALPADAWDKTATWEIVDGLDYATINASTGVLQGAAEGTVVIRATAKDGSEVYAEKTVNVVEYAVAISGQDWLLAGRTLQLTSGFVPTNLTGTTTVWSLAEGDSAYASISTTGVLTAKPVTEQHKVTVIASAADGKADAAQKEITIYPLVSAVKILQGESDVTGLTLVLNSNTSDTLTLFGALYPSDAKGGVVWSLSATDAATMVVGEDGSVTLTPIAGKTKLLTLTAKANDGSGILASVKIQVSALSGGVTVGGVPTGKLNAGKSAQLTATFADPQPANRAVKWTLAPEYEAFASLSASGLLTAKAVTDAVTIQVFAVPADGGPSSEAYEVTINPMATAVVIKNGEAYVTGATLTLDMGRETSMTFAAETWPDAASDEVSWSSSAPLIATVDADGVVTALKAGIATITATAKDGSNKSATVKISITTLPQSITAISPILNLRGGVSANYSVKDDATGKAIASNLVRWTMIEGNAAYASITTAGALKTNVVPCKQTIKLLAEVIGNESNAKTTVEVTIYPAVQSMSLFSETALVSGGTLLLNAAKGATATDPEGYTLSALLLPADAQQDIAWSSSNANVAKVTSDGVVTPVWNTVSNSFNKGTAVITAKALDGSGKSVSTTIQVVEGVQSITFKTINNSATLASAKSVQLLATADNATATNKKINLRVTEGAAYVTLLASGLLTAKTVYEDQTVKLEAYSADGYATAELTLTILAQENTLRILNWDESKDYSGTLEMIDANAAVYTKVTDIRLELLAKEEVNSGKTITWSVAPSYVAKVVTTPSGMQLQALATGVAVVTARTADGRTASFTLEIYRGATSLTIAPPKGMDPANLTLASGKSILLTGAFAPATNITTKGIVWSLDGEGASLATPVLQNEYATISTNGLVTAKANLTEQKEITVRGYSSNAPYLTSNDLTITLMPIVNGLDIVDEDSVVRSGATLLLDTADGTLQLGAVAYPNNASQNVSWTSSNKAIATVSSDGLITAIKAGQVTITAQSTDGSAKSASLKLTVATRVQGLSITSAKGFEVRGGATLQLGTAFTPTVPTDKRVTWTIAPEYAQYATISTGGLLSTKALTHAVTIEVKATSVDNPAKAYDTVEVRICPPTTKVMIVDESEKDISGQTLMLELNSAEPKLTLATQNLPQLLGGAMQGVVWTTNNPNVLKISASGELTPVLNTRTGLYNTGLVTITATASDGSGKNAYVKVNVAYFVSEISFASDLTMQGGKTLTLKPTFAPLNATNKTVKWSIAASDMPYATISTAGVVTAKKVTSTKTITITCAAQDGSGVSTTVTVTITP